MWTKWHGLCADMLIQIILCLPAVRSTIIFDTRVSESQVCKHTHTNTPHQLHWYTQKHEHKCTNTTKFMSFLLHQCCCITTIIEITNKTSTFWLFVLQKTATQRQIVALFALRNWICSNTFWMLLKGWWCHKI